MTTTTTSSSSIELVLPLPYGSEDLDAARAYIAVALRHGDERVWGALAAEDRLEQTWRALVRMDDTIKAEFGALNTQLEADAALYKSDALDGPTYATVLLQHGARRQRLRAEQIRVQERLGVITAKVKARHNPALLAELRSALLTLAVAVDEHRRACHGGSPSHADTALWARLVSLRWPTHHGLSRISLAEAVKAERDRTGR